MPSHLIEDRWIDGLIQKATEAKGKTYAPYSKFPVGAALLTKSGKMYSGCNVENSSFGLTVCAERVALFKAVSDGEREFQAIAIVSDTEKPISPCGACRQVLAEFTSDLTVIMSGSRSGIKISNLLELLPDLYLFPRI